MLIVFAYFLPPTCSALQAICRTGDPAPAAIEDVGVDHGRTPVRLAQQFLNRANVIACFQPMRRKRMTQNMRIGGFGQADTAGGCLESALGNRLILMVSAVNVGTGIHAEMRGREYPLPFPLTIRVEILAGQDIRERHSPKPVLQIMLV